MKQQLQSVKLSLQDSYTNCHQANYQRATTQSELTPIGRTFDGELSYGSQPMPAPENSSITSSPPLSRRRLLGSALSLAAFALTMSLHGLARARPWKKIGSEDGIQVFKQEIPGSKLHAFRGTALVDAPMEKIIWVLSDNKHRTDWVDRLETSTVLEKKNEYDFIVYQHFSAPPMISDRDFVFRAHAYSRTDGSATIQMTSVKHPKAPKTQGVRGELRHSSFVLKRVGNKTHVDVSVHLDPKGALPSWVVNVVQKNWPIKTLAQLRKQVKKPFVREKSAPPIG